MVFSPWGKGRLFIHRPISQLLIARRPADPLSRFRVVEEGELLIFQIKHLQPKSEYVLHFKIELQNNNTDITFPHLHVETEDTVKFVRCGILTFILENQMLLNFLIISFCIILTFIYLIMLSKSKK